MEVSRGPCAVWGRRRRRGARVAGPLVLTGPRVAPVASTPRSHPPAARACAACAPRLLSSGPQPAQPPSGSGAASPPGPRDSGRSIGYIGPRRATPRPGDVCGCGCGVRLRLQRAGGGGVTSRPPAARSRANALVFLHPLPYVCVGDKAVLIHGFRRLLKLYILHPTHAGAYPVFGSILPADLSVSRVIMK